MKQWLKNWWFSILMWLFAAFIQIYTIIATNIYDEEILFLTLIILSSITPTLMLIIIGCSALPRKENKNE